MSEQGPSEGVRGSGSSDPCSGVRQSERHSALCLRSGSKSVLCRAVPCFAVRHTLGLWSNFDDATNSSVRKGARRHVGSSGQSEGGAVAMTEFCELAFVPQKPPARYSSPATAALGRLLLPYLFPELSAFTTVEDHVSHLRASDARYRVAVPAAFLDRNPPPMDHFLSLDPTSLTVDLLEKHLLAAETSALGVGAARGTPRPPFFEGCSPSPLAPSYVSAAAADVSVPEDVGGASASTKRRSRKGKGGRGGGGGSGSGGGGSSGGGGGGATIGGSGGSGGSGGGSGGSGGSGGGGTGSGRTGARRVSSGGGQRQQ
ncbi:unnamed protein product, partial [Closterium sp. NIES-53]